MAVNRLMAKLVEKKNLTASYLWLKFTFGQEFLFTPGQYVSIKVAPEGMRRSYSIASVPRGKEIELVIDTTPLGPGSKLALSLKPGEEVEMLGPVGNFRVAESKYGKALFVATGSGIVPFRPMIEDLLQRQKFGGEIHLEWGMRHIKDLFWVEEFKALEKSFANFKFDVVLSQPEGEWLACSGHVNDCLIKHKPRWEGWEAYICGSQKMIMEVGGLLQKLGVAAEDVHFEKFF